MNIVNNSLVRGSLAGAIATIPMTLTMGGVLNRRQGEEPFPPGEITQRINERAGAPLNASQRRTAAWLSQPWPGRTLHDHCIALMHSSGRVSPSALIQSCF